MAETEQKSIVRSILLLGLRVVFISRMLRSTCSRCSRSAGLSTTMIAPQIFGRISKELCSMAETEASFYLA